VKITKENLTLRRPTGREMAFMEEDSIEGFYDPGLREVVIKPSLDREHRRHVLAHELGHSRHQVPGSFGYRKFGSIQLIDLGNELVANYYALVVNPKDREAKSEIRALKHQAVNCGMDPAIADWKERKAMKLVGYKGRPVRSI